MVGVHREVVVVVVECSKIILPYDALITPQGVSHEERSPGSRGVGDPPRSSMRMYDIPLSSGGSCTAALPGRATGGLGWGDGWMGPRVWMKVVPTGECGSFAGDGGCALPLAERQVAASG